MTTRRAVRTSPLQSVPLLAARRLVVTKQGLAGPLPKRPSRETILATVRELCYLQIDPVSVLGPAQATTLWSRLGNFRTADLDRLVWTDRSLFQYVVHAAALVRTDEYPLYASYMRRYPESLSSGWGSWREHARRWIPRHAQLRSQVLRELRDGPRRINQFAAHPRTSRSTGGWGSASDVSAMLFHLWMAGHVMVVGSEGNQNLYGRTEQFLPGWVDRTPLDPETAERTAAQRAIRAQGIASESEISFYFVRGCYRRLPEVLGQLEVEGTIHPVRVEGFPHHGVRYVHDRDLDLLASLSDDGFEPRISLLSPFDSMICRRSRIEQLFGFSYAHENYIPKAKRKHGVYVLPILAGDRFLGRIDPRMDRATKTLIINSVHAEPGAPGGKPVASEIGATIARLGEFLGARSVRYAGPVPEIWQPWLRGSRP